MSDNAFYYNTLINSLVFSPNIKNDLKINCSFFENNRDGFLYMTECFGRYLEEHKAQNIFDGMVKNNIYEIANYLYEKFPYVGCNTINSDKLLLNDFLNAIKKYLNVCSNNTDYIREQILMRDYGIKSKLSPYWSTLKKIADSDIELYKEEYYVSISRDILILNLLKESEENFYHNDYEAFLLNKDFYRSINYFMVKENKLFENSEYLKRVKFIREKDLDILTSGQYEENNVDEEFYDIASVNNRLIKKFK